MEAEKKTKYFYTKDDLERNSLDIPGQYPYTRGLFPMINQEAPWAISANCGFGLPEETNAMQKKFIRDCQEKPHLNPLGRPQVAFYLDLPTQLGYDSDSPLAQYDVGKCGTPINSLADMETLLQGIPVEDTFVVFIVCAAAPIILAMFFAYIESQKIPLDKVKGNIPNDAIMSPISDNMIVFEPKVSLKLMVESIRFCTKNMPNYDCFFLKGYSLRERGASAVQEVAFCLAAAIEIIREAIKTGLNVDDFAHKHIIFFNLHSDLFEEIAKIRATRRMWAKIMKEKFGAKNPLSWMCRIQGQTGGSTLTAQEPLNNIARVALQSMAGALGGVQIMVSPSYLEALSVPTEHAQHISYQTQHILQEEIGITEVVDPLGGSYYVEALTDRMERGVQEYLDIIEEKGGYIAALEEGYLQREIAQYSASFQEELVKGERVIVGVNKYMTEESPPVEILSYNPKVRDIMAERVQKLKKERDNGKVKEALRMMEAAARGEESLMPYLIEAAQCYATVGEITDTLRKVLGKYEEVAY